MPQAARRMQRWRGECLCLVSAARQDCNFRLAGAAAACRKGHVEMGGWLYRFCFCGFQPLAWWGMGRTCREVIAKLEGWL